MLFLCNCFRFVPLQAGIVPERRCVQFEHNPFTIVQGCETFGRQHRQAVSGSVQCKGVVTNYKMHAEYVENTVFWTLCQLYGTRRLDNGCGAIEFV